MGQIGEHRRERTVEWLGAKSPLTHQVCTEPFLGAGLCDSVGDAAVDKMGLRLVDVIEYNVQDTVGVGDSTGPFKTHDVRAKESAE